MTVGVLRDLRTARFWRHLVTSTLAAVGFIATALSLYELFAPGDVARSKPVVLVVVATTSLSYGGWKAWPRPVGQKYHSPNTEIRVVIGDLFDEPGNLVVGMCDTFDTEIPHIIERRSVQGQFLDKIYGGDVGALDRDLAVALSQYNPVENVAKPGKTARYPVGTVAAIRHNRRIYFCVAFSKMSVTNVAQGSIDSVWRSLNSLWESISVNGNGDPVAVPVLGGGLSRISQILPAQDSIRFIALSFILASRSTRICDRLDIVVRQNEVENLDMPELQAFLSSLRPS